MSVVGTGVRLTPRSSNGNTQKLHHCMIELPCYVWLRYVGSFLSVMCLSHLVLGYWI